MKARWKLFNIDRPKSFCRVKETSSAQEKAKSKLLTLMTSESGVAGQEWSVVQRATSVT